MRQQISEQFQLIVKTETICYITSPQQKKMKPQERERDPQKSLFFHYKISLFRVQNRRNLRYFFTY